MKLIVSTIYPKLKKLGLRKVNIDINGHAVAFDKEDKP